jgi:hypothetical protein
MRNILDKSCRENQNTHFMSDNFFFENLAVYEMMLKKYGGASVAINDTTIWRMRFGCWISKATCTRPEARTEIRNAFPRQQ